MEGFLLNHLISPFFNWVDISKSILAVVIHSKWPINNSINDRPAVNALLAPRPEGVYLWNYFPRLITVSNDNFFTNPPQSDAFSDICPKGRLGIVSLGLPGAFLPSSIPLYKHKGRGARRHVHLAPENNRFSLSQIISSNYFSVNVGQRASHRP